MSDKVTIGDVDARRSAIRQMFEAWIKSTGWNVDLTPLPSAPRAYKRMATQRLWLTWESAHRAHTYIAQRIDAERETK
jgi:hypothetical protein